MKGIGTKARDIEPKTVAVKGTPSLFNIGIEKIGNIKPAVARAA